MSAAQNQTNKLITENLDTWTTAIKAKSRTGRGSNKTYELYGIKKLRELILDLAVRGLLVPQEPNDEPASELLKKIAVEKEQLIKASKIKKQKPLPVITEEEKPFELPDGWVWSRLLSVSEYIQRGKGPKYADKGKVRVISQKCIQNTGFNIKVSRFVSDEFLDKYQSERFLKKHDLLWNSTGTGTVGRINVLHDVDATRLVADSHVTVVRALLLEPEFIKNYISSSSIQIRFEPSNENTLVSGSTKQVELNTSTVNNLEIPIPPLSEQKRIVAKVDELMALCDQLEQQTDSSIKAHKLLVKNLLNALTQAKDHKTFHEAWQRFAKHFDTLFTTEHSIDQLKQTILQLAVMGKLVSQNPNDEPATGLLKKIAAEKEKLIKEGKIKKQKPLPEITEEEKPFELPKGWEFARFSEIGELARGKSKHRPRNDPKLYHNGTIKLVQTGDVARSNEVIETHSALYNETGLKQSRLWHKGTLCITIAANIADTGILGFDACFPDSVVGFIPLNKKIPVKYFDYFIRTAKSNLEKFAPSTAQKNINLGILESLLIPAPPLNEQKRIVAKVDKLMILCDQIKSKITNSKKIQTKIADTLTKL